ncbi:nucleotidyltransferase [Virgibacillus pantothenticus]|uniref:nucleotidyltransferase n=1 Tax=Virgibacillus pantothenticus TaxID=1473 RepID=UPI00098544A5|nr:nucleotidyltransferase [Virgibacillus pantothenticus]
MQKVKNIGLFFPTDHEGYLLNESSLIKVQPAFLKIIEKVTAYYKYNLWEQLHSVYIRGSIPRGLAIYGVSDLDTIAISTRDTSELNLQWVNRAEQELTKEFHCVSDIEFSFYHLKEVMETSTFSLIPFMLKTHSICVYGEDLSSHLPKYKADKTLGNEHLVNLEDQIKQAKEDLKDNTDVADILDCCGWIMKIIVRAGLALVIEKENKYTRDLFPAYKLFSTYYPEKELQMKQALAYAIDPVENANEIVDFLDGIGTWMIREAEKWLQVHNPKKQRNLAI